METWPAARLMIAAGIKNGEILRGPPSMSAPCSRSMMSNPPMPEPMCTPTRSSFSGVIFRADILNASSAAATARWMKRPIFLTSFFSTKFSGSKFLTSAAIWQANLLESNCVIRATPLLPASRPCHTSGVVFPTPQIRPMPVTTTLRPKLLAAFRMLADVIDGVLHGADLFRVLVRNLDVEAFFESHHQFDRIQRVRAQVVHERSTGGDLAFVHAQLLNDDLLYFLINGCHVSPRFKLELDFNSMSGTQDRQKPKSVKRRTCSVTVWVNHCKGRDRTRPISAQFLNCIP